MNATDNLTVIIITRCLSFVADLRNACHDIGRNSAVRIYVCDLSCSQLAVLVAEIASYLQSGIRE